MARRLLFLLFVLILCSLALNAQQTESKFDLFGGYSYFNGSTSGASSRYSLNGWNAQGTYNFTHSLGLTADIGGYYGSPFQTSAHVYSYLFGPTVQFHTEHVTPFVHALFGVDNFHADVIGGSGSDSSWAMALGGGFDIPVKGRLSIRAAQVDWLRTNHFSTSQNNVRISTGVVFRFGE